MTTILISGAGQDAKIAAHKLAPLYNIIVGSLDPLNTTHFPQNVRFEHLDITHSYVVDNIVRRYKPDYILNTAGQSSVSKSFDAPALTIEVNTNGVLNFLEAIRNYSPETRFLNLSSSEIFGRNYSYDRYYHMCQNESTPHESLSPYALSKINAQNFVSFYRTHYNLYACSAICFNHTSKYRPPHFIEQKVARWLLEYIKNSSIPKLQLGNLHVYRDWSHARDIIDGCWLMLNTANPRDYVLGSGRAYSIEQIVNRMFSMMGLSFKDHIIVDFSLVRQDEQKYVRADYSRISKDLGWKPNITLDQTLAEVLGVS